MTASSAAVVFLALLVLLMIGHAIIALLVRQTMLYWFERWAAAYLIGMAALSGLWIASGVFSRIVHPVWLVMGGCAAIGLLACWRCRGVQWFSARASGEAAREKRAVQWPDVILGAILGLEFLALGVASLRTSLGFDGIFNFEMKARLMFNQPAGQLPLAYLSDGSRAWSHPQYPLMVPFGELWIYTWLGRIDQAAIKILFPLFFFALVSFVCGSVWRIAGRRAALATGVALGLLPPLTLLPGASSGYADVPLAAAFAGSVAFASLALRTGNLEVASLAGLLLMVATWTKTEGVVLAGSVGILGLCLLRSPTRETGLISRGHWLAMIWMPFAAAVLWLLVQYRYGIAPPDFLPVSARSAFDNLERLPGIGDLMIRELLRPGHWGLVWPACGIALFLAIRRRRAVESDWFLVGVILLPLTFYVLPFMLSSWVDVTEHVRSALPRLLVPLAPIALLFSVITFWRESYS